MDRARELIKQALADRGRSMAWLSRELGRNHAYVQQFIQTATPSTLEFKDALKVSELLGIPIKDLVGVDLAPTPSSHGPGLAADTECEVEAYVPTPGSGLATSETVSYFRVLRSALDRHELEIRSGDLVAIDTSVENDGLRDGDAVLVRLGNKKSPGKARFVIRQFVKPGLIITNSSGHNSIIRLDDESLLEEPLIVGRVTAVIRQARA